MVFSSILFLWVFLPLVFGFYYLTELAGRWIGRRKTGRTWVSTAGSEPGDRVSGKREEHPLLGLQNGILVCASLLFYAWGEPRYILLMLCSVCLNYGFGLWIEKREGRARRILMAACAAANLLILGYFKYWGFLGEILNRLLEPFGLAVSVTEIPLPIGISFYTFQALSYVADVYRGENRAQRNLLDMMLYISFFPQLIAGPIVKYHDIEEQIRNRRVSAERFAYGIKRFILGLGKKVILSNSFAVVVDEVYASRPVDVSPALLWFAALLYMLQIYFDFSGYSDMAIGLGQMFGFRFQENFNLPYRAVSIRDFWRRWHISLSGWFREYVYIPLGGNRKGSGRTYFNLVTVFFLTGLWHGAGWSFIFWGLYHGFFSILERVLPEQPSDRPTGALRKVLRHAYTLFVVYIGWIFFRAETLGEATAYLRWMVTPHESVMWLAEYLDPQMGILLAAGLLLCGPWQAFQERMQERRKKCSGITVLALAGYMAVLWYSILLLVNNTYNPFIYFRF